VRFPVDLAVEITLEAQVNLRDFMVQTIKILKNFSGIKKGKKKV